MRTDFVVMNSPVIDSPAGLGEIPEPVEVQTLISEFPVEAFNEGILGRLARLDEMQMEPGPLAPEEHLLPGKLRAIVADDRPWQTSARAKALITAPARGISMHRTGKPHQPARPPLRKAGLRHKMRSPLPPCGRRYHFPRAISFRAALSSRLSASRRLSLAFSDSSARSRLASETSRPPNFAFHRYIDCSLTPWRLARTAAVAPASCSLRMPMIFSSVNRFFFILGPPSGVIIRKSHTETGTDYGGTVNPSSCHGDSCFAACDSAI